MSATIPEIKPIRIPALRCFPLKINSLTDNGFTPFLILVTSHYKYQQISIPCACICLNDEKWSQIQKQNLKKKNMTHYITLTQKEELLEKQTNKHIITKQQTGNSKEQTKTEN